MFIRLFKTFYSPFQSYLLRGPAFIGKARYFPSSVFLSKVCSTIYLSDNTSEAFRASFTFQEEK